MSLSAPIGVFDSGIGGLSVLRALMAALPHERFVYAADSAHAPYGEMGDEHVLLRSRTVLSSVRKTHGIKAYVVACNTATAAAGQVLRLEHADLPIIGIEPALKPGALATQTGRVGVLATRGTLSSGKFRTLRDRLSGPVEFVVRACDGLAAAIEMEALTSRPSRANALIDEHLAALGALGTEKGQIDTVVLGCTHYPLLAERIQQRTGPHIRLIDPGEAVARHTRDRLAAASLLSTDTDPQPSGSRPEPQRCRLHLLDSGNARALSAAVSRWLVTDADPPQTTPFALNSP